jgi:hypothetical protein
LRIVATALKVGTLRAAQYETARAELLGRVGRETMCRRTIGEHAFVTMAGFPTQTVK